jgi:hypothetical protein
MSFEAAVTSTGGNDTVLAKSFVIVAERDALAWYSCIGMVFDVEAKFSIFLGRPS